MAAAPAGLWPLSLQAHQSWRQNTSMSSETFSDAQAGTSTGGRAATRGGMALRASARRRRRLPIWSATRCGSPTYTTFRLRSENLQHASLQSQIRPPAGTEGAAMECYGVRQWCTKHCFLRFAFPRCRLRRVEINPVQFGVRSAGSWATGRGTAPTAARAAAPPAATGGRRRPAATTASAPALAGRYRHWQHYIVSTPVAHTFGALSTFMCRLPFAARKQALSEIQLRCGHRRSWCTGCPTASRGRT